MMAMTSCWNGVQADIKGAAAVRSAGDVLLAW